jgi:hypothetical protein
MKNLILLICAASAQCLSLLGVEKNYRIEENTAQYGGSDYAHVIQVERGISLKRAYEIADANPAIDYFVYLKGGQMVLPLDVNVSFDPSHDPFQLVSNVPFRWDSGASGQGYCRIFRHGDVVFFEEEGVWLGSAPGLADTYFKVKTSSQEE